MDNNLNRVPFHELQLADPAAVEQWAATALFSTDNTTDELAGTPGALVRPLVRAVVWSLTEAERQGLLQSAREDDPAGAEARMAVCTTAVRGAAQWSLLAGWQVAR
ncbi:hypothetical protein ACIRPK_34125 [Kitasatospora sp. NPDC101801]|uniref:hypothetical protein n=1 Tax=Kitasatospora sp. NPDC101801 TaxID=3364103 RepID=UPI00381D5FD8